MASQRPAVSGYLVSLMGYLEVASMGYLKVKRPGVLGYAAVHVTRPQLLL